MPPRVQAPGAVDPDPVGPLPDALYGAQLPERLSDSTFWRMVRELSEPGGYFQSENFVSNEMGLQHVIAHLQSLTPPGGAYVGVGPEQNFTYLGALRPASRSSLTFDARICCSICGTKPFSSSRRHAPNFWHVCSRDLPWARLPACSVPIR
ncbi:MAG: hypothetical protein IPP90_02725 [Gemmatimonadaceae bacterium]|nr:hypothetical protein [Gemmatimonadaceae bacterium]